MRILLTITTIAAIALAVFFETRTQAVEPLAFKSGEPLFQGTNGYTLTAPGEARKIFASWKECHEVGKSFAISVCAAN